MIWSYSSFFSFQSLASRPGCAGARSRSPPAPGSVTCSGPGRRTRSGPRRSTTTPSGWRRSGWTSSASSTTIGSADSTSLSSRGWATSATYPRERPYARSCNANLSSGFWTRSWPDDYHTMSLSEPENCGTPRPTSASTRTIAPSTWTKLSISSPVTDWPDFNTGG